MLFSYVVYFLPFHQKITNIIASSCLSASAAASLIAYISTIAKANNVGPIVALFILVIGVAVGGI